MFYSFRAKYCLLVWLLLLVVVVIVVVVVVVNLFLIFIYFLLFCNLFSMYFTFLLSSYRFVSFLALVAWLFNLEYTCNRSSSCHPKSTKCTWTSLCLLVCFFVRFLVCQLLRLSFLLFA